MKQAKGIANKNGYIIVTTPLYFDILDRLNILFTGSIISMDNLCYGRDNYLKFRSYNYDHIRFFKPKDIIEIGDHPLFLSEIVDAKLSQDADPLELRRTGWSYGG